MLNEKLNTVLITGSTGFVGLELTSQLSNSHKFNVRAVVRRSSRNSLPANIPNVCFESINAKTDWKEALQSVDIVIHLAARVHVMKEGSVDNLEEYRKANVFSTINLARQAALSGVKRFIFLSSVKALGEQSGFNAYTEQTECVPIDAYGKSKLEAEIELKKVLENTNTELVIIRPPLIYGAGVKANFNNLIKLCDQPIPLPFGAIKNNRSLIYLENLTSFIEICCLHPDAANQTFLISDDKDVSTTKLIHTIKKALKKPAFLIPIPHHWLVSLLTTLGKADLATRLLGNLKLDISKAKALLGWHPPFTFEEGVKKTVDHFKK